MTKKEVTKVYEVFYYDGECNHHYGTFSTKKKAKEWLEKTYKSNASSFDIETIIVDKE